MAIENLRILTISPKALVELQKKLKPAYRRTNHKHVRSETHQRNREIFVPKYRKKKKDKLQIINNLKWHSNENNTTPRCFFRCAKSSNFDKNGIYFQCFSTNINSAIIPKFQQPKNHVMHTWSVWLQIFPTKKAKKIKFERRL